MNEKDIKEKLKGENMEEKELTDEEFDKEVEKRVKEFVKIEKKAGEFAKLCVEYQWEFIHKYSDDYGMLIEDDDRFGIFFRIIRGEDIINIFFLEDGFVGLKVEKNNH